ncbi:hypothetical protein [Aeropyrum camini]|uniref:hypothetical protein n=1 Tax=Aeropyrum camini TaxID=229980 RepID=UPI001C434FE4|nr:hypothetical protein [Aeropyrum camini]
MTEDRSGEGSDAGRERRSLIKGVGVIDDLKLYRGQKILSTARKLNISGSPI